MPNFTCFATEKAARKSQTLATAHAVDSKVYWTSWKTTPSEALKESQKPKSSVRVFPCESTTEAEALARVLA